MPSSEPVSYTDRKFLIWADFHDRYDAHVRVITSSSAEEDQVWIFTDGGSTDSNDGAILLTPEKAVLLRKALKSWLRSVTPDSES
jgi:hypothetical protein